MIDWLIAGSNQYADEILLGSRRRQKLVGLHFWILPARRYPSVGISRRRVSVCVCVCVCLLLSHAGSVSKRLNIGSRKQRHVIAHGL